MTVSDAKRLKLMEAENAKLKEDCGRSSSGYSSSQGCSFSLTPEAKRACSQMLVIEYKMSERRACCLVGQHRSVQRYRSRKADENELKGRIKEVAYENKRFGYRRIHMLLIRAGIRVNHKKVYRAIRLNQVYIYKKNKKRKQINPNRRKNQLLPGRSVALADTLDGCEAILRGDCDGWRESSLYMVGTLAEAQARETAAVKAPA